MDRMRKCFKFKNTIAACAIALAVFVSCDDSDDKPIDGGNGGRVENDFHVAFANGSESISATLVQGLPDLTQGTISPTIGHQLESSRTARIFLSTDGTTLYSLNYTEGTIEKLTYQGKDEYKQVARIDAGAPLGSKTVRFTKINDEIGSVHFIGRPTPQYEDPNDPNSKYIGHKMVASIGILNLKTMTFRSDYNNNITVNLGEELTLQGYNITRIDSPVLVGGKLYYGAAVSKFNADTGKNEVTDKTFTLIVDYNDLSNVTVITTDKFRGATNGYRTPTQHVNEAGEILQLVSGVNAAGKNEIHIAKIKNGQYDETFDFNLSAKLGKESKSSGWFYAGKGIGYIPYEDLTTPTKQIGVDPQGNESFSAMWKLARVDFNKGTVVDLNVPDDLWLFQYQNAPVRDNKLYIALGPIAKEGHIYIFDVDSESKDGTKGASVTGTGVDQYFIGVY